VGAAIIGGASTDLDWIDPWEQARETCPGCGMACEHEDSPRVTLDSGDPALDDDRVAQFSWYNTSTQADWPTGLHKPALDRDSDVPADHRLEGDGVKPLCAGAGQAAQGRGQAEVTGPCNPGQAPSTGGQAGS
jgi:hypothetical protein